MCEGPMVYVSLGLFGWKQIISSASFGGRKTTVLIGWKARIREIGPYLSLYCFAQRVANHQKWKKKK